VSASLTVQQQNKLVCPPDVFGISAVLALVLPTTGEFVNIHIVNLTTFLGAALFLAAAVLAATSER